MSVILLSFSLTFGGGDRFDARFFQDSMVIFYHAMTIIIELQNSSITDALVSTLMNCFVDSVPSAHTVQDHLVACAQDLSEDQACP